MNVVLHHGLTPRSPPCKNYKITPQGCLRYISRGHELTIEPYSINGIHYMSTPRLGNYSFLKQAFLRPKSRDRKVGKALCSWISCSYILRNHKNPIVIMRF